MMFWVDDDAFIHDCDMYRNNTGICNRSIWIAGLVLWGWLGSIMT